MTLEFQQEALQALLERSGRDGIPIRRSFTQQRTRGGGAAPLAAFVTERHQRALDLYLLLHALASASPWNVGLPSTVWARLLGMSTSSAGSMISRQWSWLEEKQLISSQRKDGKRELTLLREDGTGTPYTHPGLAPAAAGGGVEGDYFTVPYAYWDMGLQDRIDLPTKAVLLIALSRPHDEFLLPHEHAAKWYGISPDSIKTGIKNLRLLNLLDVNLVHSPTPLGANPYRTERHYTLRAPMRHPGIQVAPDPVDTIKRKRQPLGRRRPRSA